MSWELALCLGALSLQAALGTWSFCRRQYWQAAWSAIGVIAWGLCVYAVWLQDQPLTDVGACYQGMTLPARSFCHTTLPQPGAQP